MIALAAAVVKNLVATVGIAHRHQALGYLGDRGIPVYGFKGSILATPERRGQPVLAILIVIEARSFLAEVAGGARMGLIAANADYFSIIVAASLDFDTTVQGAQNTGTGLPFGHVYLQSSPL